MLAVRLAQQRRVATPQAVIMLVETMLEREMHPLAYDVTVVKMVVNGRSLRAIIELRSSWSS